MNTWLNEMYGTVPAEEVKEASVSEEELQKVAELELLAKVAAENGIKIADLSSEQVTDLLESVKIASEDEDEKEEITENEAPSRRLGAGRGTQQ